MQIYWKGIIIVTFSYTGVVNWKTSSSEGLAGSVPMSRRVNDHHEKEGEMWYYLTFIVKYLRMCICSVHDADLKRKKRISVATKIGSTAQ